MIVSHEIRDGYYGRRIVLTCDNGQFTIVQTHDDSGTELDEPVKLLSKQSIPDHVWIAFASAATSYRVELK